MPPKNSKKRPTPYVAKPRQSARQANKSASKEATCGQQENAEQNQQVISLNPPETSQNTSHGGQHVRVLSSSISQPSTSANSEPQPSTSRANVDEAGPVNDVTLNQVNSNVSRTEFQQLKDSMSSMRDMLSNFMANFNPMANNSNSDLTNDLSLQPHAFQRPPTVPVAAPVVVQQPPSSQAGDANLPGTRPHTVSTDQAASSLLNQALSAHMQSVSGDRLGGKTDVSYQLDRNIPHQLMQDIWEDKFVDLELLIDKKDDPTAPMTLKSIQTDHLGEIVQLVKPKPPKGITNIDQWSHAFNIYTSMYTRKYQSQTHNLLTYAAKVRELASKGGDYIRYDEEFRRSRSRYGTPWEIPDLQLWVDCNQAGLQTQVINIINSLNKSNNINLPFQVPPTNINLPFQVPPTNDPKPTKQSIHPNGACYTYHNQGRCGRTDCKFSHICYNKGCGQEHSVFTCPKSPGSGLSGPTPSTSGGKSSSPKTSYPGSAK